MRAIVILCVTLAVPWRLSAQEPRLERMRQVFPAEAIGQIEGILSNAAAAGVPTDPLVAKALEGVAKRVPAERVIAALAVYAQRLGEARSLVGAERDATAVVAGADALRRGVPVESIRRMAGEHRGPIAVPLVVMGDLVEAGVPGEQAYGMVRDALQQERGPEELMMIPAAVRRMMREGRTPRDAADFIGEAMRRGGFDGLMRRYGTPMGGPPNGPPVPPGSKPPKGDQGRDRGAGRGGGSVAGSGAPL